MRQLDEPKILAITKELSELKIENDLKSEILSNIRLKRETMSYQGRRHLAGLPVRGQRTRSNASTAKKLNKVNRRL
jgi:small subunit ribosomal protein S13